MRYRKNKLRITNNKKENNSIHSKKRKKIECALLLNLNIGEYVKFQAFFIWPLMISDLIS